MPLDLDREYGNGAGDSVGMGKLETGKRMGEGGRNGRAVAYWYENRESDGIGGGAK
jgi:hypothetical protein